MRIRVKPKSFALPLPMPAKWVVRSYWAVFGVGALALAYLGYTGIAALLR